MTDEQKKLRKVQLAELQILKNVVSFCDANELKYYLAEGTLLGAIRHNGFIPWDDDIDICMPREDFEKFITIAPDAFPDYYRLCYYKNMGTDNKKICFVAYVVDRRYEITIKAPSEMAHSSFLGIDILPIDGFPERKIRRFIHSVKVFFFYELFRCSQIDQIDQKRKMIWWKRLGMTVGTVLNLNKLDTEKLAIKCENIVKKYTFYGSVMTKNFFSEYRKRTIFPQSHYGDGRIAFFEGYKFSIPQKAEEILEREYGDYMTLPPEEERWPKHHIMIKNCGG